MKHGGRIQAQGGNTEESESWDQGTPLLAITAYEYLENLKIKIGRREADLRSVGFDQAARYIDRMHARGGTDPAPPIIRKSYPQPPRPDQRRVDIEVYRGRAFIPEPRKETE
jgi:hypothetical protein